MPCDRVYLQQIDWKLASPEVLRAAIIRAGHEILSENAEGNHFYFRTNLGTAQFRNGSFQVPQGFDVTAIKTEYSKEAVERAAKKYSWSTKKLSANKYQLTRTKY